MTDSTVTICGTTNYIGTIEHLKKDSNLETWSRLIEVINKGLAENDNNSQQLFIESIKYLMD